MRKFYLSLVLGTILSVVSCTTKDNINYMKNVDNEIATQISAQSSITTIQPGDQLIIVVSAKDDDVVKPFNKNYSASEISQFSDPSINMPMQAQTKSVSVPTYMIDSKGLLDFPIIGIMDTKGRTVEELKKDLTIRISKYVKNPTVYIKTNNFKVTVLGEVNKAGHYIMPEGQTATLLSALGMAGDLTIYGVRDRILIVRNVDGTITKEYVDISNPDFTSSPYFYLKQNDIIYVTANKAKIKSSNFGPQTAVWISVASIVVTILALVIKK